MPPTTPCGKSKVNFFSEPSTGTHIFVFKKVRLCYCVINVTRSKSTKFEVNRRNLAEKWPRTASGLPSTAGTTASVAFIRRGKIYIGHVGDSGIILGYQENGSTEWRARPLTRDHKPENLDEMTRINQCGGKVVAKSGQYKVCSNKDPSKTFYSAKSIMTRPECSLM